MQSMQNFHLENELGNKRQLSEEDFFELVFIVVRYALTHCRDTVLTDLPTKISTGTPVLTILYYERGLKKWNDDRL